MKIVILDIDTVVGKELTLDPITALGEAELYTLLPPEQIAGAVGDAEILLCNKAEITAAVMDACPNLKMIGVFATGYNNIDMPAAAARGITVVNVPGYSTEAVAQHTFALLLSLACNIGPYDRSVHAGDWVQAKRFTYFAYPLVELAGKTLGVFGFGAIGRRVAAIGRALGMNILVSTRTPANCPEEKTVPAEALFRESDALTFHCPLTEETREIIWRDTLALMRPSAFLINTARGGLMNEQDVADALQNGVIAGAGIDVLSQEPMKADNPLLTAPRCILTPHVAWAPLETRKRLIDMVAENIRAFIAGAPINIASE